MGCTSAKQGHLRPLLGTYRLRRARSFASSTYDDISSIACVFAFEGPYGQLCPDTCPLPLIIIRLLSSLPTTLVPYIIIANLRLLLPSGQTRAGSTTTEAESYMRLARLSALLPTYPRAAAEHYALDSLQNLLFALARFRELAGRYPAHITVVGYAMKRRRFEELHRKAIRWPKARFEYVGIDADADPQEAERAREGEVRSSISRV